MEEYGWQTMKRRVAMIELLVTCVLGPFFTTRCLPLSSQGRRYSTSSLIPDSQRRIYYSREILYWMLGIFAAMCAVNNFLLHLVGVERSERESENCSDDMSKHLR